MTCGTSCIASYIDLPAIDSSDEDKSPTGSSNCILCTSGWAQPSASSDLYIVAFFISTVSFIKLNIQRLWALNSFPDTWPTTGCNFQLSAHHFSLVGVPQVVTNSAPCSVKANLHPAFPSAVAAPEPEVPIAAAGILRLRVQDKSAGVCVFTNSMGVCKIPVSKKNSSQFLFQIAARRQ